MVDAVLREGGYAELMHLYAISAATGVVLQSYMPPVMGLSASPYTCTIVGRNVHATSEPAAILIGQLALRRCRSSRLNRTILCCWWNVQAPSTSRQSVTTVLTMPTTSHTYSPASVHHDAGEILTSDTDCDDMTGDMTERLPEDTAKQGHEDGEVAPSSPVNGSTYLAEGMQPLPGGDWLTTCDIVAMLKQPPHDVHRRVPDGVKSNLFCLVDYEVNHARRQHGECRAFDDDCGAWNVKGGRTIVIPYLIESDGSMRRLFLHQGAYCNEWKVDGRRQYIPLEPQPDPTAVVTLGRYYTACQSNPSFQKRVTWFVTSSAMEAANSVRVAVAEYLGQQLQPEVHGNAKTKTVPYIRTPAATMDKLSAVIQSTTLKHA